MLKNRLLKANEIDVRVGGFNKDKTGGFLLLYKDARVDMAILDETFGICGWQRKHELINGNLFCTISIYDKETKQWISKQDVGTESHSDKEKGQASDAFKRAGFNIGIGRELYTAPFIWINGLQKFDKFKVKEISYNENREIDHLIIVDEKGNQRYKLGSYTPSPSKPTQVSLTDTKANAPLKNKVINTDGLRCLDCNEDIKQAEEAYSNQHYGKSLCRDCQKNNKKLGD